MQQLIDLLQEAYDSNPTERDYRQGLAEAIGLARSLKAAERSHIKQAFREGSDGIIDQTGEDYLRRVYEP